MSVLLVIVMYAIWSSIFSIGKMTLEHCSPLFFTATRMLLAAMILLGYLAVFKRFSLRITLKQFFALSLYGIFAIYLTNALEFWSLQHLSATKTCFLYSLSPFVAALFSYFHFGEKMNRRKWIGLGLGLLGMSPVFAIHTGSESSLQALLFFSWPELAMLGAVFCSAYGWVLLRRLVKDSEVSPLTSNGFGMAIGGLCALLHSYFAEIWDPIPVVDSHIPAFIQGVILITIISNIVCFNLYGFVLKKFTATFVSFMGLLSPLFASITSWFLLGEPFSLTILLSTGIVGSGLWLVYGAELQQGYIKKTDQHLLVR